MKATTSAARMKAAQTRLAEIRVSDDAGKTVSPLYHWSAENNRWEDQRGRYVVEANVSVSAYRENTAVTRFVTQREVDQAQRIKKGGANGATATRHAANVQHKDLDDAIRGCLTREEKTGAYVKDWAKEYEVSTATVHRRIRLLKLK